MSGRELQPTPERIARAALSALGRPGSLAIAAAVAQFGAQEALDRIEAKVAELGASPPDRGMAAALLASAAQAGLRFVIPGDPEWPQRLGGLDLATFGQARGCGAAVGLWVQGPLALGDAVERSVAVVGSRAPTDYGVRMATGICLDLAASGWTVVSGAAYGIDAAAHRGALAGGGPTIAVLAGGADVRYPAGNAGLLERIGREGLVVSEVPPGGAATRRRFLIRNRIIAALTTGTLLVEAGLRSGARNTVAHARALDREVLGVPGPVTSAMSVGVHLELRRAATLVTSAEDVLESLAAVGEQLAPHLSAPLGPRDGLSDFEASVLDASGVRVPKSSTTIARAVGASAVQAGLALVRLEAAGLVRRHEDGWTLTDRGRAPVGAP